MGTARLWPRKGGRWGVLAPAVALAAAGLVGCGGAAPAAAQGPQAAVSPNPLRPGAPTIDIAYCTPKAAANAADPCWKGATATPLANVMAGAMPSGFSATFQAVWNNSNLYVLEAVVNPNSFSAANANTTDPWESDAMEVYVSSDNGTQTSMGSTDTQFDIPLGAPSAVWVTSGQNDGGVQGYVSKVSGGYDAMMAIPWADIGVKPGIGQVIGIDPATDTYSNGSTQNQSIAWGTPGSSEQNPSIWGQAVLQK